MDKAQLTEFIRKADDKLVITEGKQFPEVTVPVPELHRVAAILRDDKNALFDFLYCLTGVDYGQDLGVIYHLRSTVHGHAIVLKTRLSDRVNPTIDSVSDLWKTADLHEREVFDLFGIKFNNHPDLRRLFLDKTWGFPLRKDYIDDVNIVTK